MELLEKMCAVNGVSGNENEIRALIADAVTPYCDELSTDSLGNLLAHKRGTGKKLLLLTHMDEAGLFVTLSDGRELKAATVGAIKPERLNSCCVELENGDVGILCCEEKGDKIKDYTVKLFSDSGDHTGQTAAFERNFRLHGGCAVSKALSSRVGCYLLTRLMREVKSDLDLYFAFTVKRHIGMKGARVAAYDIMPDYAYVLDCFDSKAGAAVAVKDKACMSDSTLADCAAAAGAERTVIKESQSEVGAVQTTAGGIPAALLCVGVHNINTPNEYCETADIEKMYAVLKKLTEEVSVK